MAIYWTLTSSQLPCGSSRLVLGANLAQASCEGSDVAVSVVTAFHEVFKVVSVGAGCTTHVF